MNTTHKRFLEALRASLQKKNIDWTDLSDSDWYALFRLADSQGVLPLVYQATYDCPSAKEHADIMASYFGIVSEQVAMQAIKTAEFLEVYQRLCNFGVKPLIIKGLICRNLYPFPDYRPSTDEDVFIPANQFEICHKEFMDYGMQLLEEDEDIMRQHEVAYWKKPSLLYIELHKTLFVPESDAYGDFNRFFTDAHEMALQEMVQGVPVYTLNYTDHLFYLICHAFKHFIGSGFGIRQVCDITLFANQYGKEIDWEVLRKQCEEISAERLVATLFLIGEKYLTFQPEQACYPDSFAELAIDEEDLLKDMLEGGVLGNVNLSRIHSSNITLQAMSKNRKGKELRGMLLKTVFPSRKYLIRRYKYLDKYPFLLPVAWGSRVFKYLGETNKRHNDPSKAMQIGAQRVELLRKYGVLRQKTAEVRHVEDKVEDFLNIVKYAIHQNFSTELPKLHEEVNWGILLQLAKEHNLFPLFHEVACKYSEYNNQSDYTKNMHIAMNAVANQVRKTEAFLELYRDFLKEDSHPIVMKGIVCRQLYGRYAEHRPSGDEDILVRKEDFYKVKAVMEKNGFVCSLPNVTEAQLEGIQQVGFYNQETKFLIEVHTNVMGHENEMRTQMTNSFEDVFKHVRTLEVQDVPITTMSHTDHYAFLVLHALKHFTLNGVGVRQMLDILLYQKTYEQEINWEWVETVLVANHACSYLGDIQYIGTHYLGFTLKKQFEICSPETLLQDMIEVGVFGKKDKADGFGSSINLLTMNGKKAGVVAWIRVVFPNIKFMMHTAPHLEEKPWLLPVEWVRRWGRFFEQAKKYEGNLIVDSVKKSEKRKIIIRKYGLK